MTGKLSAYTSLVAEASKVVRQFNAAGLRLYWTLGRLAHQLVQDPNKYGKKTIENFAADLSVSSGIELRPNSIYKSLEFYRAFTEKQVERLCAASVAWRNVIPLLKSSLRDSDRERILQQLEEGRLPQTKISEAIKQDTAEKPTSTSAFPSAIRQVNKHLTAITELSQSLFSEGKSYMAVASPRKLRNLQDDFLILRNLLLDARTKLEAALARLEQEIDKYSHLIEELDER